MSTSETNATAARQPRPLACTAAESSDPSHSEDLGVVPGDVASLDGGLGGVGRAGVRRAGPVDGQPRSPRRVRHLQQALLQQRELIGAHDLADAAARLATVSNGQPSITNGPYLETTEDLASWYLLGVVARGQMSPTAAT